MTDSEPPLLPEMASVMPLRKKHVFDPNGYRIVSVRLREAEYEVFTDQVRALGLSNNLALRVAARRIGGFLEIDAETRALLQDTVEGIGMLSRNILKLQNAYSQSGKVDMGAFAAQRQAFGYEFARLDRQLGAILNVSQRRIDGRFKLKEAMSK